MRIFLNHIQTRASLEETIFSKVYLGCLVLLGILFGLSSYLAVYQKAQEIPLPIPLMVTTFLITGLLTIFAYYFSFLGVLWAMSKLFKGRNKFLGFVRVSTNALPPIWIALPIINFFILKGLNGVLAFFLLALAGLCVIIFIVRMISIVSIWFGMTRVNTYMSLLTTFIFLGSFLYLQLG